MFTHPIVLRFPHRDPAAMPRSPTSSEDEMAQSFSDYSMGSESDSSKEETIYDTIRATAEKPGGAKMDESQSHPLVIRVVIQDLQQTVSPCAHGTD
jgi:SH3/ankyrin repeat-containing protein